MAQQEAVASAMAADRAKYRIRFMGWGKVRGKWLGSTQIQGLLHDPARIRKWFILNVW